jgi:hypothetical protein
MADLGHIYLLTNPAMEGLVKIGHTKKADPQLRVNDLSSSTAVPLPFRLERTWLVENPAAIEASIHAHFRNLRLAPGREFFLVSIGDAERAINGLLYGEPDFNVTLREVAALVALYRKYPSAFRAEESTVAQFESLLAPYDL